LRAGDRLPLGDSRADWLRLAGGTLLPGVIPPYSAQVTLAVILGPQLDAFTPDGVQTLLNSVYTVSLTSDRMGYRLEGPPLVHVRGADILSEGIAVGSIQAPGNGQPVILLSDRQTTGGYTKIATVITADLPLAAQCPPGLGQVRFRAVSVAQAQARLREQMSGLAHGIELDDFAWG
jgi:allophanate hydrolase subunit 2